MAAAPATHNNNFTDEKTNETNIKQQMELYRGNWKPHQVFDPAMLSFVVIGLRLSTFAWLLLFWLFWLCQTQLVWLANISFLTHNIPKTFQVWWKIAAMTTLPSHHFSWLGLGRCFKILRCFLSFCKWLSLLFDCVPTGGGWVGLKSSLLSLSLPPQVKYGSAQSQLYKSCQVL